MPTRFSLLFPRFKFSLWTSASSVFLAALMFWAASWQWGKYHLKTAILASYANNSHSQAAAFDVAAFVASGMPATPERLAADELLRSSLRFHKVHVSGKFDLDRQVIVTNRKDKDGPGHLLLAPLQPSSGGPAVWVSRGFVPFADRTPETWTKYDEPREVSFDAVVQQSVTPTVLGPGNPDIVPESFPRIWFFEEIEKLNLLLPYPALQTVFLQRLGGPPAGRYPEESVQIQVPPTTHFGYTIEWSLLGSLALIAGFLIQAFPIRSRHRAGAHPPKGSAQQSPNVVYLSSKRKTVHGVTRDE